MTNEELRVLNRQLRRADRLLLIAAAVAMTAAVALGILAA
jgi:hypothetical protein